MTAGFALISLIWGSTWLAIKIGLQSMPPFYGLALRFSLAMIILFVLMKVRRLPFPTNASAIKLYFTLGVCSFSLPFGLVYWGEQYVASGLAAVLFAVYPFVVAVFSHFFLPNERLNKFKIIGILLAFSGILLIFRHDLQLGNSSAPGMIAILCSTLLQGIAIITAKKLGKDIHPVVTNFGGMLVGVPIMFLLALLMDDASAIRFDAKGIGSVVYLGTFGSVVTFVIYYWLLKHIEAVYMSLVAMITPVLAVFLGAIVLGEVLQPGVFSGALLVLSGIVATNSRDLLRIIRERATTKAS